MSYKQLMGRAETACIAFGSETEGEAIRCLGVLVAELKDADKQPPTPDALRADGWGLCDEESWVKPIVAPSYLDLSPVGPNKWMLLACDDTDDSAVELCDITSMGQLRRIVAEVGA